MADDTVLTRDRLADAPYKYFAAVDAKDMDGALAQYAADAVETFLPVNETHHGIEEIQSMYVDLFASYDEMRHDITNVVVDVESRKVATEQVFVGANRDGQTTTRRYNCNFFTFDDEGKVARVIIWRSDSDPTVDG